MATNEMGPPHHAHDNLAAYIAQVLQSTADGATQAQQETLRNMEEQLASYQRENAKLWADNKVLHDKISEQTKYIEELTAIHRTDRQYTGATEAAKLNRIADLSFELDRSRQNCLECNRNMSIAVSMLDRASIKHPFRLTQGNRIGTQPSRGPQTQQQSIPQLPQNTRSAPYPPQPYPQAELTQQSSNQGWMDPRSVHASSQPVHPYQQIRRTSINGHTYQQQVPVERGLLVPSQAASHPSATSPQFLSGSFEIPDDLPMPSATDANQPTTSLVGLLSSTSHHQTAINHKDLSTDSGYAANNMEVDGMHDSQQKAHIDARGSHSRKGSHGPTDSSDPPAHVLSSQGETGEDDDGMIGPDGLLKIENCLDAVYPDSPDGTALQCHFCLRRVADGLQTEHTLFALDVPQDELVRHAETEHGPAWSHLRDPNNQAS